MAWPKVLPPLTPEQERISEDFVRHWHEVLPRRYGVVERFNHSYVLRSCDRDRRVRTLELGPGLGEHLEHEDLDAQEYHCVELRPDLADRLRERFPDVTTRVGDCQTRLPYEDSSFDRIVAVHVLEHLPDLPAALDEVQRLLRPGGSLGIVIPCDPGAAYGLARRISAQRIFERRYGVSYDWFISREHLNSPAEIVGEIRVRFDVEHRRYFPLRVPIVPLNLCLGLTARARA